MISLIVTLLIVGVLLYIFNILVPLDSRIRATINVPVGLFLFLYILQSLGIWHGLPALRR